MPPSVRIRRTWYMGNSLFISIKLFCMRKTGAKKVGPKSSVLLEAFLYTSMKPLSPLTHGFDRPVKAKQWSTLFEPL